MNSLENKIDIGILPYIKDILAKYIPIFNLKKYIEIKGLNIKNIIFYSHYPDRFINFSTVLECSKKFSYREINVITWCRMMGAGTCVPFGKEFSKSEKNILLRYFKY